MWWRVKQKGECMKLKKLVLIVIVLGAFLGLVGCKKEEEYDNGGKYVKVNLVKDTVQLKNVKFYNFAEYDAPKGVYTLTGKYAVLSNSYNSTELYFADKNYGYVIKTDKVLSDLPDTLKIYTDANKTTAETYTRK